LTLRHRLPHNSAQMEVTVTRFSDFTFSLFYFLNEHRLLTVLSFGLFFWGFAYTWYFSKLVKGVLKRGKPHTWRVDQVNKVGYSHGARETQ